MGIILSRLVLIWLVVQSVFILLLSTRSESLVQVTGLSVVDIISGIVYIQIVIAVLCFIYLVLLPLKIMEKVMWGIILVAAGLLGWPIPLLLFFLFYYFVLRKNYAILGK